MCGIAGIINASTSSVKELASFIKDAILTGSVRGVDSVGIASVDTIGEYNVYKDVLSPVSFITAKPAGEAIDSASDNYFTLIHHRAATVGKVSVAAAQPFHYIGEANEEAKTEFDLVLCHNGTLTTGFERKVGNLNFASDSDWLAWAVSENLNADGVPDFEEALRGVSGSFSIVASVGGVAYMLNNGDRPMHVAWSEKEDFVLFASEPGMLAWLAERNAIKIKNGEIHKLKADTVYSFDYMTTRGKVTVSSKPYVKKYKSYTPSTTTTSAAANPTTATTTPTTTTHRSDSDVDKLYTKVASGATETATLPTPASNVTSISPAGSYPQASRELKGKMIEFILNDIDVNLGVAFGTCWSVDDAQLLGLSSEAKQVLASATCMLDLAEVDNESLLKGTTNSTFIAPVKAVRAINEVRNGKNAVVPHLHLDGAKVREVEIDVANTGS
jgi:hypothetical protein